jgi:hypothetical protein
VFATRDCGTGTLLMAEKAFLVLDDDDDMVGTSHAALARRVIRGHLSSSATTLFADLHPVVLGESPTRLGFVLTWCWDCRGA